MGMPGVWGMRCSMVERLAQARRANMLGKGYLEIPERTMLEPTCKIPGFD